MAGTILVKKKDGTQVRMTMDEFKEYQKHLSTKTPEHENTEALDMENNVEEKKKIEQGEVAEEKQVEEIGNVELVDKKSGDEEIKKPESRSQSSSRAQAEVKPEEIIEKTLVKEKKSEIINHKSEITKDDLPMVEEPHELATTTPVKDIFVDEAVASTQTVKKKAWTKEDNKSPLEDKMEELKQHEALEVLPDKKQDLFTEVLKKIKFPISDDLQARLHSLISSRVKEVRTDDQFLSYVGHPVDSGGLGLDDSQSQELLQTVKDVWHIVGQKKPEKIQAVKEESVELKKPKEVKKHKVNGEARQGELRSKRESPGGESGLGQVTKLNISLPRVQAEGKPVLHDILKARPPVQDGETALPSSEKHSIGPIDEIRNFSLVDLRRMGNDPVDNFKKLLQKFKDLKKDSIVLYLEAVQTWYESPLYKQYQDIIFRALDTGVKAKDLAVGGETLTWEEVEGIIKLQKKFT